MDIFSLCDVCVYSVRVICIHARLSAGTHPRIIYNSALKPSCRQQSGATIVSLMPQSSHVCQCVCVWTRRHTYRWWLLPAFWSASAEEKGFKPLFPFNYANAGWCFRLKHKLAFPPKSFFFFFNSFTVSNWLFIKTVLIAHFRNVPCLNKSMLT